MSQVLDIQVEVPAALSNRGIGAQRLFGIDAAHLHLYPTAALGDLEISVTPPIPISKEVIRQYEDIGVHRLIPWLNAPRLDDTLRYVDELGALLSG